MTIKIFKPYTPSTRQKVSIDFSHLSKKKPEKSLTFGFKRNKGRNNQGKITCRHKGGGHKRLYRFISFKRNCNSIIGKIASIEYDPNRTSFISQVDYSNGKKEYILSPNSIKIGQHIICSENAPIITGNSLPLSKIPYGTDIHNIEIYPGKGGQIARSAGCFGKVLSKEKEYTIIKLSSKEVRLFHKSCFATIGKVSNLDNKKCTSGKAGRSRWLGIRPTVRGSAMNPIDHPHGGGEGRSPIGRPRPLTPWGKVALGKKTRIANKKSNNLILHKRVS